MVQQKWASLTEEGLVALAEVAQLYYLEDYTQEQIAGRIGVSRSNVSRMLKEARARGLVDIKVRPPLGMVSRLQDALKEVLGLKECLVLATSDQMIQMPDSGEIASKVGAGAARYLREVITDDSIVGVGWSSTVYHHVVSSGYLQEKKGVNVAQLMGSVGDSIPELNGMHIAARLASALGANTHYLHAPLLVSDVMVRDALMSDQSVKKTLDVARRADVTLVGIGAVDRESGQYRTGYLNDDDLEYIRGEGAVGEVCGTYFLPNGAICPVEMNERTIAMDFEGMIQVPTRIGVSWGQEKAIANIGAVRSGLINMLVTDEPTARKMLGLLDEEDAVDNPEEHTV